MNGHTASVRRFDDNADDDDFDDDAPTNVSRNGELIGHRRERERDREKAFVGR